MEGFGVAMHLSIELKVGCDSQLYPQHRARYGLHVRRQFEARELVHVAIDGLAHLGKADQLANLLWRQVIESFPREVLALDLLDDVLGDVLELAQRRLRQPHPPVDHLAEVEDAVGERCPPALQHNLM
eukprot:scaffold259919_cov31-Tisochrysis_lutea.AAC.5